MEYPCRETTMPNLSSTSATAASDHMSRDVPVQPRAAGHCLAHLLALLGSGAPPVDQSASAAVNKPLVALSHNEAAGTLSPLGSAPETVPLAQFLRDRNTSNEITGLGLERLAGSSELDITRPSDRPSPHFPFPRQLSGRSFASCTKQQTLRELREPPTARLQICQELHDLVGVLEPLCS